MKTWSYALGKNVWLNSKCIKKKQNQKLEAKFFNLFRVLYLVDKKTYKLKLLVNWKTHNVFYLSLLEQDITKRRQINDKRIELKFAAGKDKKYEVEIIQDSAIYTNTY